MDADNAVAQATAAPPVDCHAVAATDPEQFFRAHFSSLVHTVQMIRGATRAEAEEAVAQAMSRALHRWNGIKSPRAYVLQSALRAFVKEQTQLPRIRARQVERRDGTLEFDDDPRLTAWEDQQWVQQFLDLLPPAQREVMTGVVNDLSPSEIAKILGRSPEAVRRSLADARKRLKRALEDEKVADSTGTPGREAR